MKLCKYCNIEKSLDCFDKNRSKCKDCRNKEKLITKRIWREKNKEELVVKNRAYFIKNKEKINKHNLDYYYSNIEKVRKQSKSYRKLNKHKLYLYKKNKLKTDINFRLTNSISSRIRTVLKRSFLVKNIKSIDTLGCSVDELKNHLESKFLPTMTWENYGDYWHIDHIIPCSSFDLSKKEEQQKCFHYTNLQPLFATTQVIDGITYIGNINKNNKL